MHLVAQFRHLTLVTTGHGVLLEDGIEVLNKIMYNVMARATKPARGIPNMGSNGDESDRRFPSLFWITNPENIFVGNVATGSLDAGFWFEPLVRGPRKAEFLAQQNGERNDQKVPTQFKDNVARGNLVSEMIQWTPALDFVWDCVCLLSSLNASLTQCSSEWSSSVSQRTQGHSQ